MGMEREYFTIQLLECTDFLNPRFLDTPDISNQTGFSSFVKKSNFTPDFSNIPINPHFKIFKDRVNETAASCGWISVSYD